MKGILHYVLDPLLIFWLIMGAGCLFHALKRKAISRWLLVISFFWLFLVTVSPLPVLMTKNLESTYPVFRVSKISHTDSSTHIMLLGGGYTFDPELPITGQLSVTALARLTESIRIYRLLPGSRIICSGTSTSLNPTQADMTARAAIDLGVDAADTLMLKTPGTTEEEARHYTQRFGKEHKLILVTSAIHMPRAMEHFAHMGIHAIPAPANHMVKTDPEKNVYDFEPSASKITMMKASLHEYAGLFELLLSRVTGD